jgi:hypothetical protein
LAVIDLHVGYGACGIDVELNACQKEALLLGSGKVRADLCNPEGKRFVEGGAGRFAPEPDFGVCRW